MRGAHEPSRRSPAARACSSRSPAPLHERPWTRLPVCRLPDVAHGDSLGAETATARRPQGWGDVPASAARAAQPLPPAGVTATELEARSSKPRLPGGGASLHILVVGGPHACTPCGGQVAGGHHRRGQRHQHSLRRRSTWRARLVVMATLGGGRCHHFTREDAELGAAESLVEGHIGV